MGDKREVYISNIQILFSDLEQAINDYIESGHLSGDVKYINAYLMAVLGAIVAYKDTVLKEQKESENVKACKYANNMLKHDLFIVTHVETVGGFHFPIHFPLIVPKIDVVWKWQDLNTKHADQKLAFKELFAGKPVLKTLEGVLGQLGVEVKS